MRKPSVLSNEIKLRQVASSSFSRAEILRAFELKLASGNYKSLYHYANMYSIKLPESNMGNVELARSHQRRLTHEEIFTENSKAGRPSVKTHLRKIWATWECFSCGVGEEWNGKFLSLQLEHVNGIYNDNRLENLALLCPNCHSQTDTYAGKALKGKVGLGRRRIDSSGKVSYKKKCLDCDAMVSYGSLRCPSCYGLSRVTIEWPSVEEILKNIESKSYTEYAKELGVTDNTIRKHLRREGIDPPRIKKV